MASSKIFLCFTILSALHFFTAFSNEFSVGGEKGWVIPKDDQLYNDWASKNRFKVDDILRFEYQKDSVMVVSKAEYEKCRSARPVFFSNDGHTAYKLDRPGLFYFISGVSGHCERGLKMIVKVLETENPPQPSTPATGGNSPPASGGAMPGLNASAAQFAFIIISFLGTIFM
ncbi:unnamed protein product [Cuscuta epithymum]|uniref:Phytocyanin domain-containing protein n=1 Tax=Cuscuta epithymum TaxID=186058 RepID=A0AAV0F3P6_9ASTE|nr:unnamed protein product [Cuscuta epithymum]CAH9130160.1 unnamed protein product [Cuscuta epithymum]